jgi:hypothetical protein
MYSMDEGSGMNCKQLCIDASFFDQQSSEGHRVSLRSSYITELTRDQNYRKQNPGQYERDWSRCTVERTPNCQISTKMAQPHRLNYENTAFNGNASEGCTCNFSERLIVYKPMPTAMENSGVANRPDLDLDESGDLDEITTIPQSTGTCYSTLHAMLPKQLLWNDPISSNVRVIYL